MLVECCNFSSDAILCNSANVQISFWATPSSVMFFKRDICVLILLFRLKNLPTVVEF